MISFVTAAAFLVVAFISPILSGIADFVGNKKTFMKFFVTLGSLSCIGLYWFELEAIYLGLFFYFLAMIGIWSSLVFYNSYLPDVAYPEQQDRASARGFSMGYIGSVLLLLFNLSMVMMPDLYGIEGTPGEAAMKAMRYSLYLWVFGGILLVRFLLFLIKEINDEKITRHIFWNGFRELRNVYHQMAGNYPLKRYLSAFFFFSLTVQTVMLVAAYLVRKKLLGVLTVKKPPV